MNMPGMFVGLLFAIAISCALAQESCILTETSCQCAPNKPSGSCVRSQGDGTCILGQCSEGYRCDCFGYEMCSVSTCGKHIATGAGIMSETQSFPCKMEPGAGSCTDQVGFVETGAGAKNAEAAASNDADESSIDSSNALIEVSDMMEEKKAVAQVMKDVERFAEDIPEQDLKDLEATMDSVLQSLEEGTVLAIQCVEKSRKAYEKLTEGRKYKRVTLNKESEIKEREERIKKTKDSKEVDRLKTEISGLKVERNNAAKACATSAKQAREYKKECKKGLEQTREKKRNTRAAREAFTAKARSCMDKARQRKA